MRHKQPAKPPKPDGVRERYVAARGLLLMDLCSVSGGRGTKNKCMNGFEVNRTSYNLARFVSTH